MSRFGVDAGSCRRRTTARCRTQPLHTDRRNPRRCDCSARRFRRTHPERPASLQVSAIMLGVKKLDPRQEVLCRGPGLQDRQGHPSFRLVQPGRGIPAVWLSAKGRQRHGTPTSAQRGCATRWLPAAAWPRKRPPATPHPARPGPAHVPVLTWGYPSWMRFVIGTLEGLGAILLMIPSRRTRFLGATTLAFVLAGAVTTHIINHDILAESWAAPTYLVISGIFAPADWRDLLRAATPSAARAAHSTE
ncbi:DoxX family protein [Nonomuraea sp. NPDC050790]|uniref:DoxX family protein n=1 Tax=Nonomuraea sp. NPDC050790 TaxID=3364371 RepID=UPI0037910A60